MGTEAGGPVDVTWRGEAELDLAGAVVMGRVDSVGRFGLDREGVGWTVGGGWEGRFGREVMRRAVACRRDMTRAGQDSRQVMA